MQEATAGNPFFALELGRELVRTNTRPAPGQALRVPESLQELLGGRLARLPGETLDVLLQVAALARPTVELVAAAHGDRERVLEGSRQPFERASSSSTTRESASRIPCSPSICYEEAPIWKRRAVHRALAACVSDVEERARHLALAADGPDAAVASGAGQRQPSRRPPAGRLPRRPSSRARRRADAGRSSLGTPATRAGSRLLPLAGAGERAAALLEQLLAEVPSGVGAVRRPLRARLDPEGTDATGVIELCDEALAEAADDDARSARILAFRS